MKKILVTVWCGVAMTFSCHTSYAQFSWPSRPTLSFAMRSVLACAVPLCVHKICFGDKKLVTVADEAGVKRVHAMAYAAQAVHTAQRVSEEFVQAYKELNNASVTVACEKLINAVNAQTPDQSLVDEAYGEIIYALTWYVIKDDKNKEDKQLVYYETEYRDGFPLTYKRFNQWFTYCLGAVICYKLWPDVVATLQGLARRA